MKCSLCGSIMESKTTSLPFKVNEGTIVILKELPVFQCNNCSEYLLSDPVLLRVEEILEKVDTKTEIEIIQYAA